MFRFIGRRMAFIVVVCVVIIFFVNLGMSMVSNSQVATPDYDLVERSLRAWQETRAFVFGNKQVSNPGALREAYVNSMGLLAVALALAALVGLWIGGADQKTSCSVSPAGSDPNRHLDPFVRRCFAAPDGRTQVPGHFRPAPGEHGWFRLGF